MMILCASSSLNPFFFFFWFHVHAVEEWKKQICNTWNWFEDQGRSKEIKEREWENATKREEREGDRENAFINSFSSKIKKC